MGFNQKLAKAFLSSAGTFTTLVAGSVKAGSTVPIGGSPSVSPGTLVANVTTAITTSTIVLTASWQVSQDGTTFVPIFSGTGAAYTNSSAAGTGSLVTSTFSLAAPFAASAYPYARCVLTNSVTTGGAGDTYVVSYNYVRNDFN